MLTFLVEPAQPMLRMKSLFAVSHRNGRCRYYVPCDPLAEVSSGVKLANFSLEKLLLISKDLLKWAREGAREGGRN